MFVIRSDVDLQPGQSVTLRFAYGAVEQGADLSLTDAWKTVTADDAAKAVAPQLFYFAAPGQPHLQRELAWHTWQIEASVGRPSRAIADGSAGG